ncbi:flagellar protein FlbD [Lentibacillus salicampi]|uniref:Flagellar protein FlbD n=2 Tax=Lentibacillus salicampi TaxID=175306 RepID=A0A4Y9AJV7_9BACI|nr:flagellar FlbD family protein [Lentibacillus salicampi]TFJ94671.1 flagellar protein FlbD [Lentibacillus salicampi]
MMKLTRLNGNSFTLNASMIEQVQSLPDTTITLTSGKKLLVKDSEADVSDLVTDYYKQIGLNGKFYKAGDVSE